MKYRLVVHEPTDWNRSANGGDYYERIIYYPREGRSVWKSSADFPMCPNCGRYTDHAEADCMVKAPKPSRSEMAAARRGDTAASHGWEVVQ